MQTKTKIDYDLNIYIPEEYDEVMGDSSWDPANWHIHVYDAGGNSHKEVDVPRKLTQEEIISLGLNKDPYFKDSTDTWYGYQGFMFDYWSKMPDSLKQYLEALPKYE